jgi:squalene-hopene/tetraprenyl-beta-curcumene cyclase
MKTHSALFLAAAIAVIAPARAAGPTPDPLAMAEPDRSLQHEIQHAIDQGLAWLGTQQNPAGFWSNADYPAITGLVLLAYLEDPSRKEGTPLDTETLRKAHAYLISEIKPDGGIYQKGLANYNTSISLTALLAAHDPADIPAERRARAFLVGGQKHGPEGDPFDGGVGYGDDGDHSDLSNTVFALEALYHSRALEATDDQKGAKDLDWKAAIGFVERCQNLPEVNKQPWASDDPQNKGGFVYFPGSSKAGEMTLPDGKKALRSYGSMSYAGLLSYAYADLKPDDPRVTAVHDWLSANYTVNENPGMGAQGLYYYFQVMAKGLGTYGAQDLVLKDGRRVNWRADLAQRLFNLQKPEGFWQNDNGRWWEKDPILSTAYSVIALETIARHL